MNRILFVDDDPNVLQGLRRMLRDMRHEWEMEFAGSGEEALTRLAAAAFHVMVTDMRMPGMDGAQLLTEVTHRHPGVVRIVLSGQADKDAVLRTVGVAHQYLSKPCDADLLKRSIGRACARRSLLPDDGVKRLVSRLSSLPSLPALYVKLVEECQSPRGSLRTVGEIIAADMGMTAKILHLVNASFFGVRARVSTPMHAVQLLGLDTVKVLALSAGVFSQFEERRGGISVQALWRRSVRVSAFAGIIASDAVTDAGAVADASVAGLLHDVGLLILAANLPARLAEAHAVARREGGSTCDAEVRLLGASHAMVAAYLLGLWGLPDRIVDAVAFHHAPRDHAPGAGSGDDVTPLTAVHVATALTDDDPTGAILDEAYVTRLGLTDRIPTWREAWARREGTSDE